MANINVTIRMDEKLKTDADNLFKDLGLNLSSAITMFVKQAVREERIPFEIKRLNTTIQEASNVIVKDISQQFLLKNKEAYKELAK